MEERRYAYKYGVLDLSSEYYGQCFQVQDTTDYVIRPDHIPISEPIEAYMELWYYPVPTSVSSFADFTGKWYYDQEHTQEATELNN